MAKADIERLAEALRSNDLVLGELRSREVVRAILTAMREPSSEVLAAASPAYEQVNAWAMEMQTVRGRVFEVHPDGYPLLRGWKLMIDKLLSE